MTILDNGTRNQYTATAAQTVFVYDFEIFESTDIRVYRGNTLLALTTDYTLTGVGDNNGGNVVLTSGATAGDIYTIFRQVVPERLTDYQESGQFLAQEVNDDFDRLWAVIQELETDITRTLQLTEQTTANLPITLEDGTPSHFLRWDDTATSIENVPVSSISPDTVVATDFNIRRADYAAIRLIDTSTVADGQVVTVTNSGIAGDFVLRNVAGHGLTDNGATRIVINGDWYAERYYEGLADARWWGVSPSETAANNTTFLQAAVDAMPCFLDTPGSLSADVINLAGMVTLGTDYSHLDLGLIELRRATADSTSQDPVLWIHSNFSKITGKGMRETSIFTENACPRGVVRVGMEDMLSATRNVLFTEISGLSVFGPLTGGQTSGSPDIGVYRANPQFTNNESAYFCRMENIRAQNLNIAYAWYGDANGDFLLNLYGKAIGNASLPNFRSLLYLAGCADMIGSNIFMDSGSAGSDVIYCTNFNNSATTYMGNPGKNHIGPIACSLTNVVGEQGVPGRWIVADDANTTGARNNFSGADNGGGAPVIGTTFAGANTINYGDGHFQRRRIKVNAAAGETDTDIRMTADDPTITISEQDVGADNKVWQWRANGGSLKARALSDDELTQAEYMEVNRTGASINDIRYKTGASGNEVCRFDAGGAAGETRFLIYDVSAATLKRVKRGAANTGPGGVGRALYVDN